jgi:hypothetical protein
VHVQSPQVQEIPGHVTRLSVLVLAAMRATTASVCALVVIASDGGLAWQLPAKTAANANLQGVRLAATSSSSVCRGCGCVLQMAAGRGEGGRGSGGSKSKSSGRGAAAPKKRDIDMEKAVRTYQVMEDRKGKKKERKQVSLPPAHVFYHRNAAIC